MAQMGVQGLLVSPICLQNTVLVSVPWPFSFLSLVLGPSRARITSLVSSVFQIFNPLVREPLEGSQEVLMKGSNFKQGILEVE
jgi:hypothetical protein